MSALGRAAAAARVLGAVLGGLVAAASAAICLARLPVRPAGLGFAVGMTLFVPLWLAAVSAGLVARRARDVWLASAAVSGILAGLARLLG